MMMISILRAIAWPTTRYTHACVWEKNKTNTRDQKWPVCLLCPFWPGYGLSGLCLAFLTLYNLTICENLMSFVFSHRTVNMISKRFCRNCPISSCAAKYLVRLATRLADVHQLDHIQRRQYLQEAKLQPKVKVVVYESEADNSGKNHYRNPVQTQETVYELSRSRRNEASFKAKTKRPTTKNKTKRKKQKKSNSWLKDHRTIV